MSEVIPRPALKVPALDVEDLRTEFRINGRWYPAVDGVSLRVARDETLAVVGESGCGKSVTALSIMGLVQPPAAASPAAPSAWTARRSRTCRSARRNASAATASAWSSRNR
ncbi:ATP-binding cassette domain-containing protein [Roseomonas sp. CCTCC AB2023176]|uniref:ATP-binding cassette domain-containing protein n=1 Tax=Roseomonas sp. CCTCC AB2023176 TaxID=3342640 RepID=UPI0035DA7E02